MYKWMIAFAVVGMFFAGTAVAEEVSQNTLGDMGLSGMQTMSDDEGMAVRGQFAFVGGFSAAWVPGAAAGDAFLAGDTGPGPDFAIGASGSIAHSEGTVVVVPGGVVAWNITTWSAGGAVAFAGP